MTNETFGAACVFEADEAPFPQVGYTIARAPARAAERHVPPRDRQEDFLVLSGECVLVIEGEERPLKAWDFVHCPPGTDHIFVGAGDGPCVIFMAGARSRRQRRSTYPRDEVALRHGAGVETETQKPREAYAPFPSGRTARPRAGTALPWTTRDPRRASSRLVLAALRRALAAGTRSPPSTRRRSRSATAASAPRRRSATSISCQTSFGGIGGAQAVGPWIDEAGEDVGPDEEALRPGRGEVAAGAVHDEGRRHEAHVLVQRPAVGHATGSFPIAGERPGLGVRPQPELDRRADRHLERAAEPEGRREAVVHADGPDRRARRRRVPLQRARRRGPRRRGARGARPLRRPPRPVEQLPPPRHPELPARRAPKGAATLVGYAIDGFGIYVVKDAAGNLPANAALDACHGTTSVVAGTAR